MNPFLKVGAAIAAVVLVAVDRLLPAPGSSGGSASGPKPEPHAHADPLAVRLTGRRRLPGSSDRG